MARLPRLRLVFIIFSSALLILPHLCSQFGEFSNVAVDLVVTAFIGGPHLFATYAMTFMEPHYRERYRRYTWSAMFLPIIVVTLAVVHLTLLVTIFFFWASVHVIHQATYIADSYRFKDPRDRAPELARWQLASRLVDYGLLVTCLYPTATFKFTVVPLVIFGHNLSGHGLETGGGRSSSPTSPSSSGSDLSPPPASSFSCAPSSPRRCGNGGLACCTCRRPSHEPRVGALLHNAGLP